MIKLILESRINFVERKIALKLFRRFWRAIEAYSQGQTYADVLKLFFSQLCKSTIQSHRKITNANIDEDYWKDFSYWNTIILHVYIYII